MIANAQQARQLVKNSKHYRLDYLLSKIESHAKSGAINYLEPQRISNEEAHALRLRGFILTPAPGLASDPASDGFIISWEDQDPT